MAYCPTPCLIIIRKHPLCVSFFLRQIFLDERLQKFVGATHINRIW